MSAGRRLLLSSVSAAIPAALWPDVDAFQLEVGDHVTPYCDGDLGAGHGWDGDPYLSTSTRAPASLTYPLPMPADEGALSIWAEWGSGGPDGFQWLADWGYTTGILVYLNPDLVYFVGSAGPGATRPNDASVHHVDLTWSLENDLVAIYLDGESLGTSPYVQPQDDGGGLDIGHYGGSYQANGVLDDLSVFGRSLTAEEVRAIFERAVRVGQIGG